jgi:TorA maturation chaperone TorD
MDDTEYFEAGADFYSCLARAFLPPDNAGMWDALKDDLACDLEELAGIRGYDCAPALAAYRQAVAAIPDALSILQIYSSLFLAPPRKASINSGIYLDGALNGGSVVAMEAAYRDARLARDDDFLDLSDHVAIQLEFVGHCLRQGGDGEAMARSFLGRFVAGWLGPFLRELQLANLSPNPYLPLAQILAAAVATDARMAEQSPATPIERARHTRAVKGIDDKDMAFIARRLAEKGLAVDHLDIPVDQREEAMGLSRKVPPSPRRGSRLG